MVYNGKKYFVVANTQSLNGTTEYNQTDANNMCSNENAQIVARPDNDDQMKKAILSFLQPIAAKVGHRLHAWTACLPSRCGAYAVHVTNATQNGRFKGKKRGNVNAFLALCERGESSINATLGPLR